MHAMEDVRVWASVGESRRNVAFCEVAGDWRINERNLRVQIEVPDLVNVYPVC
jgi:hypothetical protein